MYEFLHGRIPFGVVLSLISGIFGVIVLMGCSGRLVRVSPVLGSPCREACLLRARGLGGVWDLLGPSSLERQPHRDSSGMLPGRWRYWIFLSFGFVGVGFLVGSLALGLVSVGLLGLHSCWHV